MNTMVLDKKVKLNAYQYNNKTYYVQPAFHEEFKRKFTPCFDEWDAYSFQVAQLCHAIIEESPGLEIRVIKCRNPNFVDFIRMVRVKKGYIITRSYPSILEGASNHDMGMMYWFKEDGL